MSLPTLGGHLRPLICCLSVAVLGLAAPANAATITVTTEADERNADGDCSLREAIESANRDTAVDACEAGEAGPDEIEFDAALSNRTVSLFRGSIEVTDSVSVDVGQALGLTVRSDADSSLFVVTSGTLSLSGLTFSGATAERGAVVYVGPDGSFDGTDLTFSGNEATGDDATDGGAAVYNDGGTVTLTGCTFEDNDATGTSGSGGALFNNDGSLTVTGSTFTGNTANRAGGAIESRDGTLTLRDTDFTDNAAGSNPGNGGALHISGTGDADVRGGTVSGNLAAREGGGFWNSSGTMRISNTTFDDNEGQGDDADHGGGALYNNGGRMELDSTTVTNNRATGQSGSGGGILNADGGQLIVMSSTVSDNEAPRAGGGVEDAGGTVVLIMSTFERNDVTANANPGNGGAVHTGGGTVVVAGGLYTENEAVQGGGLWTSGTLVITSDERDIPDPMMPGTVMPTITEAVISDNEATGDDGPGMNGPDGGGGLYATPSGSILVIDATIADNAATGTSGSGGGILSGGDLTLRNVTVSGNTANRAGGGIEDAGGTAVLVDVTLDGNSIDDAMPGNGGGLHSGGGDVSITRGTVTNNTAVEGGGLWSNGTLTLNGGAGLDSLTTAGDLEDGFDDGGVDRAEDNRAAIDGDRSMFTTISGNEATGDDAGIGGGGIYVESGGLASIRFAVLDGNRATGAFGSGGGLLVADGASARVAFSEVTDNTANRAGGGIELFDDAMTGDDSTTVTLRNVTVDGNTISEMTEAPGNGGGLHAGGAGTVFARKTTFSDNVAREGGGLWISGSGSLDLGNSTVSGNEAREAGGGVYDDGGADIEIASSTIALNAAGGNGGGLVSQGTSFRIQNTVVAGNSADDEGDDLFGTFRSGDFNLVQSPGGGTLNGTTDNTITGADPMLGPLADNGGFTRTQAPMMGSPVIDAGQSQFDVDQRGLARFRTADGSGQDDIGAVELNARSVANDAEPVASTLEVAPVRPNPAVSRATFGFTVAEATAVRVEVFNTLGQRVLTAFDGMAAAGSETEATVDVTQLAAGVYLVRMTAEGASSTQRLTVVR